MRSSAEVAADRNSEDNFTASGFHVIADYSSVTAPDDSCTVPDISFNCNINPFTDYEYDSDLEASETQFETLETGEVSHDDGSVSVLADRSCCPRRASLSGLQHR